MSFKITQQQDYFLITLLDEFNKDSMAKAYLSLIEHPAFTKQSNTLWDFRQVIVNLSFDCILENADAVTGFSDKRSSNARSAFIVKDPFDKGLLQTYVTAIAHYPVEIEIFEDYACAETWLSQGQAG